MSLLLDYLGHEIRRDGIGLGSTDPRPATGYRIPQRSLRWLFTIDIISEPKLATSGLGCSKYGVDDAFVLTAYLTDKPKKGEQLWPNQ